jgi:hypothetical protein
LLTVPIFWLLAVPIASSAAETGHRYVATTELAHVVLDSRNGQTLAAVPRKSRLANPYQRAKERALASDIRWQNPLRIEEETYLSGDGRRAVTGGADVSVWNLVEHRLERRFTRSRALALLGRDQDQLAILTHAKGQTPEFAVWNLNTATKTHSHRFFGLTQQFRPQPLASRRFAAFTDQHELWLWDQQKQKLQPLDLPAGYLLMPPVRLVRGEQVLLASGPEVLAYDTDTLRLVVRYPDAGHPLGLTPDSKYLIAQNGTSLKRFEAASGKLDHAWSYIPPLKPEIRARTVALSPKLRLNVRGGKASDEAAALDADGRLFMIDPIWNKVVAWNVAASPPKRLPDLCENGHCGDLIGERSLHLTSDGDLILHASGQLLRLDPDADNAYSLPLEQPAIAAHLDRTVIPAIAPETCDQDTEACFSAAEISQQAVAKCQTTRDTQGCKISLEAPRWLRVACINGERNLCGTLYRQGVRGNDPVSARFGAAGQCDPDRAERQTECERIPREPLGSSEKVAMARECDSQAATCGLHALATLNVEADRHFGLQLAQQGCDAGQRLACSVGGLLAKTAGAEGAALALYEKACLIAEDALCRTGMRKTSRHVSHSHSPPARATQIATEDEAPRLCKAILHSQFQGTSYFELERFVGIRVTQVRNGEFGTMPFEPGDILLDTIRCGKRDCSGTRFHERLGHLCGILAPQLLHDLTLSVRSDNPDRNRVYVLRRTVGKLP